MPAVDRWWEDPPQGADPAPPPPATPPYVPPSGPQYRPNVGPSKPSATTPTDPRWDGIAAGYKTELEDLAFQWQQMEGWATTINEDALVAMARAHVTTLRDMGQYIWNNFGWGQWIGDKPWLAIGVDQTTWHRTVGDFQDAIQRYTGQRPTFALGEDKVNPADSWSSMIWDSMKTGMSASGFIEKLTQDESIRKQYGWIRFGLTFDDFQNRKTDWRQAFGQDLSNEQALLQLEYFHQSSGASRGATVAPPRGQAPELAGVSEVTVR